MRDMRPADLTLTCVAFDETLEFLTARLGFRLDTVFPADAPHTAALSRDGQRLCLQRSRGAGGPRCDASGWTIGRAGMQYRDLLPGRLGGELVASHIRIPRGGPVPDYVHWHDIRLQLIFCYKGWVRVVYEDQGPPFVMQPGDCVLQPPRIRHRVLECSDGFEAVEISAPAEHETHVDHTMRLPSSDAAVERLFADQRFVFFQAGAHEWQPGPATGLEYLDGGFDAATAGIASLQIFRSCSPSMTVPVPPQSGFQFAFVLHGSARLRQVASEVDIGATDAFTVAAGKPWQLDAMSDDFRLLKVVCPGLA